MEFISKTCHCAFEDLLIVISNVTQILLSIFILPQNILKKFHNFTLKLDVDNKNRLLLLVKLISFVVYVMFFLNLHLLMILLYLCSSENERLGIIIGFLIFNFCFLFLVKINYPVKENILQTFISHLLIVLLSFLILVKFFIYFGDKSLIENFLMKKRKGISIKDLIIHLVTHVITLITTIIKVILILVHLFNPISIVRLVFLNSFKNEGLKFFIYSSLLCLTQDILLMIIFMFNHIFIISIIEGYIEVVKLYLNHKGTTKMSSANKNANFNLYLYVKNKLIIEKFYANLNYMFICIIMGLSSIFFWRIKNVKRMYKQYFYKNEAVSMDVILNFNNGLLELISPLYILANYVFYFNRKGVNFISGKLSEASNNVKNSNDINRTALINIEFFLIKFVDILSTLFSFTRIFNVNFYVQVMRQIAKKEFNLKYLFPLLNDEEILEDEKLEIIKIVQINQNETLSLSLSYNQLITEVNSLYKDRRTKLLLITLTGFTEHLFYLTSLITLINPFNLLKVTKNFVIFIADSKDKLNKSFYRINKKFNTRQLKLVITFLYQTIIFFPYLSVLCLLSPWNVVLVIQHCWKIYFAFPIKKIKQNLEYKEFLLNKKRETNKIHLPKKDIRFFSYLYRKTPKDWILIFRFTLVHLVVFRAVFFWKEYFFLLNYKIDRTRSVEKDKEKDVDKDKDKDKGFIISPFQKREVTLQHQQQKQSPYNKENEQCLSSTTTSGISFQSEIYSNTLSTPGTPRQRKRNLKKEITLKTKKFIKQSDFKSFKSNLYKHFQHIYSELIFYPILIVIITVTPWNIFRMKAFFKKLNFKLKFEEIKTLIQIFIADIVTLISTIFLLLSFVETIDTIILLYYSFRKYILKNPIFVRYYDLYYKSSFKGQITEMMKNLISNFFIFGLILLNVVLISRVFNLFKRIRFYLDTKIMNDISKLKHLKKVHSNKIQYTHPFFSDKNICSIAEYLPPSSIINLSSTNSYFLSVLNMNNVWKSSYNNFYREKLKNYKVLKDINPMVFENFKSLCKEVSSYLNSSFSEENKRDHLIGLLQVLREETIESFLDIPHLILIPVKFLSMVPMNARYYLYNKLEKFYRSIKFKKIAYLYYKFDHEKIIGYLKFTEIDSKIFNLQIIGFICTFHLLVILLEIFINVFFFLNVKILKKIVGKKCENTYAVYKKTFVSNSFSSKFLRIFSNNKSKLISLMTQIVTLIIYFVYHTVLFLIPLMISNYKNIVQIIDHQNDIDRDFSNYLNSSYTYSFSATFSFLLTSLWTIFTKQTIIKKFLILTGYRGVNILLYFFNYFYIKRMRSILSSSNFDIIQYDVINFIYSPTGLLKFMYLNFRNFLIYSLFPHKILSLMLDLRMRLEQERKGSLRFSKYISYKLMKFLLYTFPFLLNLIIRMSFSRIIVINVYALLNLIIMKI